MKWIFATLMLTLLSTLTHAEDVKCWNELTALKQALRSAEENASVVHMHGLRSTNYVRTLGNWLNGAAGQTISYTAGSTVLNSARDLESRLRSANVTHRSSQDVLQNSLLTLETCLVTE